MRNINLVLLDVDGVIYDFVGHMVSTHFAKYNKKPSDINTYYMHEVLGLSKEEFWKVCEEADGVFCKGQFYGWAESLIKTCYSYAKNVAFCTNPGNHPKHWAEKKIMFDNLSKLLKKDFPALIATQHKELFSFDQVVLIDDYEKTVDKFNNGEGIGVLFPQHWNKNGTEQLLSDPVGYIDCTLDDINTCGFAFWKKQKGLSK